VNVFALNLEIDMTQTPATPSNPPIIASDAEKAREIAHSCCAAMPYTGMEYEVAKEAALMAFNSAKVPDDIFETAFVLVQLGRSATSKDIRSVGQWILDTAKKGNDCV
jgi:hypothetical protein